MAGPSPHKRAAATSPLIRWVSRTAGYILPNFTVKTPTQSICPLVFTCVNFISLCILSEEIFRTTVTVSFFPQASFFKELRPLAAYPAPLMLYKDSNLSILLFLWGLPTPHTASNPDWHGATGWPVMICHTYSILSGIWPRTRSVCWTTQAPLHRTTLWALSSVLAL